MTTIELTGADLIAGDSRTDGPATVESVNPQTGEVRPPVVHEATTKDVGDACSRAADAATVLRAWTPDQRAKLLHTIADALDENVAQIVSVADEETALGARPRLEGELARTTGQLRFLADVVRDGAYLEAIIDRPADGGSIRRLLTPLGPVAVFGASNFPLAFSVAGGDTAAALAVGCPVVVKAHPSHPHTAELVGRIVSAAVAAAGAPPGTFSLVHGFRAGQDLVTNSEIRAVGFTGSQSGGEALQTLARDRDEPIPVYAEMSSVNPAVVSPQAVATRAEEIAVGFIASMTLGGGQFCTKPGLLFVPPGSDELISHVQDKAEEAPGFTLLNAGIRDSWRDRLEHWRGISGVHTLAGAASEVEAAATLAHTTVLLTDTITLRDTKALHEECFGPTSIIVRYDDLRDLEQALVALGGHLAASLHTTHDEHDLNQQLSDLLTRIAGRLVWNEWPTGVAVTWAMHHGGPYPATTNPLHTSVGATSLRRFMRPVCYQGTPDEHLPPALRDGNPLELPRRVNGSYVLPG